MSMLVCLNPGHAPGGIPDPGACGTKVKEANVVAKIGAKVSELLILNGVECVSIQNDDLHEVCKFANNHKVDLFVSIHCNAAANTSAQGTETYYYGDSAESKQAAECIQNSVIKTLQTTDRGVKDGSHLWVINSTIATAVLVETAFISNEEDQELLINKVDEFAQSIASGILDYLHIKPVTIVPVANETNHWCESTYKWLEERHIVVERRFSDLVTRAEMMAMIYKTLQYLETNK